MNDSFIIIIGSALRAFLANPFRIWISFVFMMLFDQWQMHAAMFRESDICI